MAAPALHVFLLAISFISFFTAVCNASPLPFAELDIRSPIPQAGDGSGHWVDTWTAVPEAVNLAGFGNRLVGMSAGTNFRDTTIRQTLPLSVGGEQIRIHFSNAYGSGDLPIDKVMVGLPQSEDGNALGSGSVDVRSLHEVKFSGSNMVSVPRGSTAVSDPISFNPPLQPGQIISISMYLREGQAGQEVTSHLYSQTTSCQIAGDHTSSARIPTSGRDGMSWYYISSVEAMKDTSYKSLIIIGDSITDGRGSPINADLKWPSLLSTRVQSTPGLEHISVVNQGAGGNQIINNGDAPSLFEASAVSRLDRDLLSHSGVGYAMVFAGINDIGQARPTPGDQHNVATQLISHYQQMIAAIHKRGLPAIGATLTPFMCPPGHPHVNSYARDPIREQTRLTVNQWIRNSGAFDDYVDFDKVIADPRNPSQMAPAFLGPDCLHPSGPGYEALAKGFPLDLFSSLGNGYLNSNPNANQKTNRMNIDV